MSWWQRVQEIEDFAAEEGITLPLPAETIARMEDAGNTVNLETGAIEIGGENVRYEPAPEVESKWWWQS